MALWHFAPVRGSMRPRDAFPNGAMQLLSKQSLIIFIIRSYVGYIQRACPTMAHKYLESFTLFFRHNIYDRQFLGRELFQFRSLRRLLLLLLFLPTLSAALLLLSWWLSFICNQLQLPAARRYYFVLFALLAHTVISLIHFCHFLLTVLEEAFKCASLL